MLLFRRHSKFTLLQNISISTKWFPPKYYVFNIDNKDNNK